MQFTKSTSSGVTVLVVQGSLDGTTSPQLEAELQGPIHAKEPRAVLDFAQVPLVSSAALRVLLSAAKRMKKHGGRLRLCGLRPEVKQVFDISDLTAFFDIFPDQAAALDATGSAPAVEPPPAASPVVPTAPALEPPPPPTQTPLATVPPPGTAKSVPPPPAPEPATPAKSPPTPAPVAENPAPPLAAAPLAPPAAAPEDADPGATICYPSAPRRQPEPAPSVVPTADSPSPVVSRPAPAAPPVPAAPSPPPAPPAPAIPVLPPAPPVSAPAAPLRRPAPAVLAKAASVSEQPPPVSPPPPPPTSPSGAAVHIQKNEPRVVSAPPDDKPRSLLPILAAVVVAAAVLTWLGVHLFNGKKRAPDQTARATPTPTASPAIKVPTTPSPTPAREVAAASPTPSATPKPTPPSTPVVVAAATPPPRVETPPPTPAPSASSSPAGSKEGVTSAAGAVDTNRANPENQAIREAVLHRIDAMPLSQADKDRLYVALDRARGLGKLVTINFPNGRTNVSSNDVASLNAALHRPATQRFLDDPSVVLVVLGFADVKGNDKSNKDVSELRARRVVEALRGPCSVTNMIHSLGMGGQSLAGETLEKNRVVEVWAVLP